MRIKKERVYHSPPPHSWEAHPNYKTAEINKTFIIAIVSLAAVVVLVSLLFVASQFVGKAYEVAGNSIDAVLGADGTLTITATLAAGVETGSAYLELTSPVAGFDLCGGGIINNLWGNFEEIECADNHFIFADATLNDDNFRGGQFTIAELNPTITGITSTTLTMGVVDVYDAVTGRDLFPGGGTFPITVPACASGSRACGMDVGICQAGTQVCTAGVWSECTGSIVPAAEICDGQDNDCDGQTDEDNMCQQACSTNNDCTGENKFCNRGTCVDNIICTDSDNGLNLLERGRTSGLNGMHPTYRGITEASDFCSSDYQVVEYFCRDNLIVVDERSGTFCPTNARCVDGVCVTSAVNTCTDTDGYNLLQKGYTTGRRSSNLNSINYVDYCANSIEDQIYAFSSPYVSEWLCEENYVSNRVSACSAGNVCQDGACISTTACRLQLEVCDQRDNNCNGQIDENIVCQQIAIGSVFSNDGSIPPEYTCDAEDGIEVSPPLTIDNIPARTQSLVLIMDDPIFNPSQPAVHWVMYNIPRPSSGNTVTIPRGGSVAGATVGRNQITSQNIYSGPCPPEGESHQYRFRVYALDTTITTPTLRNIQDSSNIIRGNLFEDYFETGDTGNILQQATLTGFYYPPLPSVAESPRGGGFSCTSQWSCPSTWNYCNATLQQSRTCTDTNRCDPRKLTRLENRSCTACEESWVCTPWNACQNGQQSRNCVDEHSCGAVLQKPALQKSCQQVVESGPAPVRIQPQLSPPPQIQQPAPIPAPSFWDKYIWFVTGIPAALLVIILIIFGVMHTFKPKPAKPAATVGYDMGELKEWIQKEKQMGTSNDDIKDLLTQHTQWSKAEIENKFAELKEIDSGSALSSIIHK